MQGEKAAGFGARGLAPILDGRRGPAGAWRETGNTHLEAGVSCCVSGAGAMRPSFVPVSLGALATFREASPLGAGLVPEPHTCTLTCQGGAALCYCCPMPATT